MKRNFVHCYLHGVNENINRAHSFLECRWSVLLSEWVTCRNRMDSSTEKPSSLSTERYYMFISFSYGFIWGQIRPMGAFLLLGQSTPLRYAVPYIINFAKLFGYETTCFSCQKHNPTASNTNNSHKLCLESCFRKRMIKNGFWPHGS